jgi:probable F420-dependent oxidoreductase
MTDVAVQAQARTSSSWLEVARKCERLGFDALLAADHPGMRPSPFVALAAAAAVTSRIGLGSYVSNGGVREPLLLAADVATLDLVSDGRARLGLGAGHTPAEWAGVGRDRPSVAGRVDRCIQMARAMRALLDGEHIEVLSDVLRARARLTSPRPVSAHIPITIGGANSKLLRWAGEHADVVGLSGLGKTLPDGYGHEVRWRAEEFEAQLAHVREGAAHRDTEPVLEALVQMVSVTTDPESALTELSTETGLSVADLLDVPFLLIGSAEEIVATVTERKRRWGISRLVVREDAMDSLAPLLAALNAVA